MKRIAGGIIHKGAAAASHKGKSLRLFVSERFSDQQVKFTDGRSGGFAICVCVCVRLFVCLNCWATFC